jgi:translation initiation factor 1
MQRLFAGTPFDRPPTCARCERLEAECECAPVVSEPVRIPPGTQTASIKREKRVKGKLVTVISGLDPSGNDLPELASLLKARCGAGGTVKDGKIEIQGEHIDDAEAVLRSLGYKTKR